MREIVKGVLEFQRECLTSAKNCLFAKEGDRWEALLGKQVSAIQ